MNGAMKLFLRVAWAELYLLVIRRFYVSGTIYQLLACHTALLYVMIAGAVVLAAGLILALSTRKQPKKARLGWAIFAAGVFLALSALLVRLSRARTDKCCGGTGGHAAGHPVAALRSGGLVPDHPGGVLIVLWICGICLAAARLLGKLALVGAVVYLVLLVVAAS